MYLNQLSPLSGHSQGLAKFRHYTFFRKTFNFSLNYKTYKIVTVVKCQEGGTKAKEIQQGENTFAQTDEVLNSYGVI
jgi:hypothetical protein